MFDVPLWAWIATISLIVVMLVVDFVGHARTPHAPTLKESAWWSAAYVLLAVIFGGFVWWGLGGEAGQQYFAGYITEKSLSVDNLFVFVLIMAAFKVPRIYQQKVLLIGIIIALIMRVIFILLGAALVENFSFIFYIFGAFLLYTAWVQLRHNSDDDDDEYEEGRFMRAVRKVLPTTDTYVEDKMFVRRNGKLFVTPMLMVMIAIGSADLLFAVDSIPAIFGLTQSVFLIVAANAFSLLGLRQLYFLIDGLLDKLVYLHYGLAAILAFIGAKLVIHAMHTNELPFINGGEHITIIPEVPISVSLVVILAILAITTVTSLTIGNRRAERAAALEDGAAEDKTI